MSPFPAPVSFIRDLRRELRLYGCIAPCGTCWRCHKIPRRLQLWRYHPQLGEQAQLLGRAGSLFSHRPQLEEPPGVLYFSVSHRRTPTHAPLLSGKSSGLLAIRSWRIFPSVHQPLLLVCACVSLCVGGWEGSLSHLFK